MKLLLSVAVTFGVTCSVMATERLSSGGSLKSGDQLTSQNGYFSLVMQVDGNLVLYFRSTTAVWYSNTRGTEGASCHMQSDGNLVIYGTRDGERKAVWDSQTSEFSGGDLECQNDGNLVIYRDGKAVWNSETSDRGQSLINIHKAFKLIVDDTEMPGNPKRMRPAKTAPTKSEPESTATKLPTATSTILPATSAIPRSLRILGYGKWLLRIGGKAVPYVGWGLAICDAGILLYDKGKWIYHGIFGENEQIDPKRGLLRATAEEPDTYEAITPIITGENTVVLLYHTGFLCADIGTNQVIANRSEIGEWEKFWVTKHADKSISLLSLSTGKYLSAADGGGAGLTAAAEQVGPSEKFTPEVIEDKLYLKASAGQYLSARLKP